MRAFESLEPDSTSPLKLTCIASIASGRPATIATSHMVVREDKRTNNRTMLPALKNNAACQGPVKIELLKGTGLPIAS